MTLKSCEIYNLPRGAVKGIVPGKKIITPETMKSRKVTIDVSNTKEPEGRSF